MCIIFRNKTGVGKIHTKILLLLHLTMTKIAIVSILWWLVETRSKQKAFPFAFFNTQLNDSNYNNAFLIDRGNKEIYENSRVLFLEAPFLCSVFLAFNIHIFVY